MKSAAKWNKMNEFHKCNAEQKQDMVNTYLFYLLEKL